MKKLRRSEWFLAGLVVAVIISGFIAYPMLPARVWSHWNAAGVPNGTMSGFWGAFLLPFILVALYAVIIVAPRVDPKYTGIAANLHYFDALIAGLFVFLTYIYALTLFANLEYAFSFTLWLLPAFGLLFYGIGAILPKLEPNWTIGIRTPWTLESGTVWKKTHELGGKLFRMVGVVTIISVSLPQAAFPIFLALILSSVVALFLMSYVYYRREHHSRP